MTVISRPTIEVLKNFCSINKSIVIKPGNQVATLSINKNILAIADVEEQFDTQISIYDLGVFIGGLSLFNEPKIDTSQSNYITVSDEGVSLRLVISTLIPMSSFNLLRKRSLCPL